MSDIVRAEPSLACAIAVMAKASVPGQTKTRLVPPLSAEEAALLNTAFLQDVSDNLLAAARLANIRGCIAYAPTGAREFFRRALPAGIDLIETAASDLGACLLHAASSLLAAGYGSVCLLNSDSPTLPVGYLVAAATILAGRGDRAVIGPSTDGGYYLLGLKQAHRGLFENIDWSTERVLAQTLARAGELGITVVMLPAWYDVDDHRTLDILMGELLEGNPFRVAGSDPQRAQCTRQYLKTLLDTSDLAVRLGRTRTSPVA